MTSRTRVSWCGEFEGRIPFYEDGDLMVYMPLSASPGKRLGLAFVLFMRLAGGARLYQGGLSCASDLLQISPAQLDSKGRTFRFQYTVNIDERGQIIRDKQPVEAFSAGLMNPPGAGPAAEGKENQARERITRYKPEAGRVFLLDLTADPPSLAQVQIDLAGVLARPGQDPTLDEMKAGVARLAEKDRAVRHFLDRIEKE